MPNDHNSTDDCIGSFHHGTKPRSLYVDLVVFPGICYIDSGCSTMVRKEWPKTDRAISADQLPDSLHVVALSIPTCLSDWSTTGPFLLPNLPSIAAEFLRLTALHHVGLSARYQENWSDLNGRRADVEQVQK